MSPLDVLRLPAPEFAALEVLVRAAHAEADREQAEVARRLTDDKLGIGHIILKLESIRAGL